MERTFLDDILALIKKHRLISGHFNPEDKVIEFVPADELGKKIDLEIRKDGDENVEGILETVIKYSVNTVHPHFYNQFYHGMDEMALGAAWLTETLNTNMHTYEVAPVFTVIEKEFLAYIRSKLGWKSGDGIFAPGGVLANMYAVILARHKLNPEVKFKGQITNDLVMFSSEDSQYWDYKSAIWMGIGVDNVVKIKTDEFGRMKPDLLEVAVKKSIDDGKRPFFVTAIAGTTLFGAYEDINAIADVCQKYDLWLNVDGCWGGSVLLSNKYKHYLDGIERADSFAWNAHKMLGVPLQASVFVTKHDKLMMDASSTSASYLFADEKFYDTSYDLGDKCIQTGRKVDAFKAWFMLKVRGEAEIEALINNAFDKAAFLYRLLSETPGFRPVINHESGSFCTNVCFFFVPPSLRGRNEDEEWMRKLHEIAPQIKRSMVQRGNLMVGYQPMEHKNLVNFFRMVVHCHPEPTEADMKFVVDEIARCGEKL